MTTNQKTNIVRSLSDWCWDRYYAMVHSGASATQRLGALRTALAADDQAGK